MNATEFQPSPELQTRLDIMNALFAAQEAALSKLIVRVVTAWQGGGTSNLRPHVRVRTVAGVVYGAWEECPPPAEWGAWKAVALGSAADVQAYRTAKAAYQAAGAEQVAADLLAEFREWQAIEAAAEQERAMCEDAYS